jgi:hypothetical protein
MLAAVMEENLAQAAPSHKGVVNLARKLTVLPNARRQPGMTSQAAKVSRQ